MRQFAAVAAIFGFLAVAAPAAEALTTREIIELSRAGLGEDVLLALIEVDRGVYAIDAASLKALKAAGVSERVIAAMVRSGRDWPAAPVYQPLVEEPPPARSDPHIVVVQPSESVREVVVPVPVYMTAPWRPVHVRRGTTVTSGTQTFIPFQFAPPVVRPEVQPPKEPVYWGFGGKRRPDAWDEPGRRDGDGKGRQK